MSATCLITGGSRGIGRGIALALAGLGYNLILNYRANADAASATAADCQKAAALAGFSIQANLCQADVSGREDRARLLAFARAHFPRLDLLVNNAGIAPSIRADILETSEESFDRLLSVNARGPFFLTQQAAKWMIETARTSPADYHPKIITISSVSAYAASVNRAEYCISKAALSMLTPLFASRLAEHGIGVYEIRPGIIATDMTASVSEKYDRLIAEGLTPIRRQGTPEDVGRAVAAIAQNLFPFSTGEIFNVDGGFHLRRL